MKYNCIHCSKEVEARANSGKYCSNLCQKSYESEEKLRLWVENNEKVGKTIVRRYLVETHEEKCSVCGLFHWLNNPIKLEIDHIDGDAYNNVPENLRLICPNCHSQTPTYKNRNKGNGRKLRQSTGWLLA